MTSKIPAQSLSITYCSKLRYTILLSKYDEQVMSPSEITFSTQPAIKDTNVLTEYIEKNSSTIACCDIILWHNIFSIPFRDYFGINPKIRKISNRKIVCLIITLLVRWLGGQRFMYYSILFLITLTVENLYHCSSVPSPLILLCMKILISAISFASAPGSN